MISDIANSLLLAFVVSILLIPRVCRFVSIMLARHWMGISVLWPALRMAITSYWNAFSVSDKQLLLDFENIDDPKV